MATIMKDDEPDNRRRIERKDIQVPVVVSDVIRNLDIGRIVNIHQEGFMIIGDQEVRENCLYQLAFNLDYGKGKIHRMMVGAECLWISETSGDIQIWAGFQIIDIAEDDAKLLSTLNFDNDSD